MGGGSLGRDDEILQSMAGTSSSDVWILSSTRLFHWQGDHGTIEALDAADPFVELLSDPTGVYARSRSGRRFHAVDGAWQALPEQPGPFLGAVVEAPAHPYVRIDWAQATGDDAFWGSGQVRAFGDRHDLAPAVVHYEHGVYRTFVGAPFETSFHRAEDIAQDRLRIEGNVLLEDGVFAGDVLPFVTVRWQMVRALEVLDDGGWLVASGQGIHRLDGDTWTREAPGSFEALATLPTVSAARSGAAVYVRGGAGWCHALHTAGRSAGLAAFEDRIWTGAGSSLFAMAADGAIERVDVRVDGREVVVEQLVATRERLYALVRDARELVAVSFDGSAWQATSLGPSVFAPLVNDEGALEASNLRYDGTCWTRRERALVPLREVPVDARPEVVLLGEHDLSLELRIR